MPLNDKEWENTPTASVPQSNFTSDTLAGSRYESVIQLFEENAGTGFKSPEIADMIDAIPHEEDSNGLVEHVKNVLMETRASSVLQSDLNRLAVYGIIEAKTIEEDGDYITYYRIG